MKCTVATFCVSDGKKRWRVYFRCDVVEVCSGSFSKVLDNSNHRLKPCVTHAIEAVRFVQPKKTQPRSEFEKKRRAELDRPPVTELRVYCE